MALFNSNEPQNNMRMEQNEMNEMREYINREMNFDLSQKSLAMAYVPMQVWGKVYDPETALCRGTLFPELDKPFIGEELPQNARKK